MAKWDSHDRRSYCTVDETWAGYCPHGTTMPVTHVTKRGTSEEESCYDVPLSPKFHDDTSAEDTNCPMKDDAARVSETPNEDHAMPLRDDTVKTLGSITLANKWNRCK